MKNLFSIGRLSILFIIILSCSPKGEDKNPFLSLEYQTNITIEAFILIDEQVCNFFSGKPVVQLPRKQIWEHQKYLALRLNNHGNFYAWGIIQFRVEGRGPMTIEITPITKGVEKDVIYLIPIGGIVPPHIDGKPKIEWNWIELNTY